LPLVELLKSEKTNPLIIERGVFMGDKLKSTLDIVMEKTKGMDKEIVELSEDQKEQIAEIRREYEAKIAEKKILINDKERLGAEILKLEEKREKEIEKIYKKL